MRLAPVLAAALLAAGLPPALRAQGRILPDMPSFERPLADPRATAIVGRYLGVRPGESRFGPGTEGEVIMGEDVPLVALRRGAVPVSLGFGTQVVGRFSLTDPKSALISSDWLVGINVNATFGRWNPVLHLYHESSHLGDEYANDFNAPRLDWTREVASAWLFRQAGAFRLAVNGGYVLHDELALGRYLAAAGVDWRGAPILGGAMRPFAGVFVSGESADDWKPTGSARLGVTFRSGTRRALSLALAALDGRSTQRQFFGRRSRYLGAEIRLDL